MKRIFYRLLGCGAVMFFLAANDGAMAHSRLIRVSDPALCLDGMETVPIDDDLVPTEIAMDGGCMVSEAVTSI